VTSGYGASLEGTEEVVITPAQQPRRRLGTRPAPLNAARFTAGRLFCHFMGVVSGAHTFVRIFLCRDS
jgi:hypothetical protein